MVGLSCFLPAEDFLVVCPDNIIDLLGPFGLPLRVFALVQDAHKLLTICDFGRV